MIELRLSSKTVITTIYFLCNGPNKLVLYYTRLEKPASNRHSRLLGLLVSYEENKFFTNFSLGSVEAVRRERHLRP
jgi:hypothetical protein